MFLCVGGIGVRRLAIYLKMLRALPWVLLLGSLVWIGNLSLSLWDTRGVLEANRATHKFFVEVARTSCATAEDMRAAAHLREWPITEDAPDWCVAPEKPVQWWLRVEPSPPMPMAKDNGMYMAFDTEGCWISWQPGTNC